MAFWYLLMWMHFKILQADLQFWKQESTACAPHQHWLSDDLQYVP